MKALDKFIKDTSDDWSKLLPNISKEVIQHLNCNEEIIDFRNSEFSKIKNTYGLYLFKVRIKSNFKREIFEEEYRKENKILKSPRIIQSRYHPSFEKEWQPLYLGKSENVQKRIREHCLHTMESKTFSLKLNHRNYLKENADIAYSYFIFDEHNVNENKSVIQFVITNLEKQIRNEINPWIGKQ